MSKGYIFDTPNQFPTTKKVLVGCKVCKNIWYEDRLQISNNQSTAPLYVYDACDSCYDEHRNEFKSHVK